MRSDLEDSTGQVAVLEFVAVLIHFLLVLADGPLAVHIVGLLVGETTAHGSEGPLPEGHSAHLHVCQLEDVLRLRLRELDREVGGDLGVGGVEAHVHVHVEVSVRLEVRCLHEDSGDGGMVEGLLEVNGHSPEQALKGLSEDRVERFFYVGEAGVDEHIAHGHILDLLKRIGGVDGVMDEPGKEAHHVAEHLEHRLPVEDLYRQGHVHYGFAGHQVGAYLLEDHLQYSLLRPKDLLVAEYEVVVGELPPPALEEEVLVVLVGVPRSLVFVVLDLLRKAVFEVVALKVSLLDHPEDVITEVTGMAAFYGSNDIEALLFDGKGPDLFFFVERGLALAAVLALPLPLYLAGAVLKIECPEGALGLGLPAVGGEEGEVVKVLKIHFSIVVEVVVAAEVHLAPQHHEHSLGRVLQERKLYDLLKVHLHCSYGCASVVLHAVHQQIVLAVLF